MDSATGPTGSRPTNSVSTPCIFVLKAFDFAFISDKDLDCREKSLFAFKEYFAPMFAQSSSAKGSGECCCHELCTPCSFAFIAVWVFVSIEKAVLLAPNTGDSRTVLADDAVLAFGKVLKADGAAFRIGSGSHLCSPWLEVARSIFLKSRCLKQA